MRSRRYGRARRKGRRRSRTKRLRTVTLSRGGTRL